MTPPAGPTVRTDNEVAPGFEGQLCGYITSTAPTPGGITGIWWCAMQHWGLEVLYHLHMLWGATSCHSCQTLPCIQSSSHQRAEGLLPASLCQQMLLVGPALYSSRNCACRAAPHGASIRLSPWHMCCCSWFMLTAAGCAVSTIIHPWDAGSCSSTPLGY
jgi:hypothetical protein